jgi:hypothetical protein
LKSFQSKKRILGRSVRIRIQVTTSVVWTVALEARKICFFDYNALKRNAKQSFQLAGAELPGASIL